MGKLCDLGHAAYSLPENARSPVLKASLQSAPRLHPGGQTECARSTALRSGSFSARNLKNTNVTARVWWHLRQIKEDANTESQLRAGGWKYVKSVRKTLTPRQNVRQEPEGKNDVNDVGATIHALPTPVDRALAHCQPPVSSVPEGSVKAAEDLQAVEESAPTSSQPATGNRVHTPAPSPCRWDHSLSQPTSPTGLSPCCPGRELALQQRFLAACLLCLVSPALYCVSGFASGGASVCQAPS